MEKGFTKINSKFLDPNKLIEKISPNKNYIYWEYVTTKFGLKAGTQHVILKQNGDLNCRNKYNIGNPGKGFSYNCFNGYSYIVYIENGNVIYVTDEKDFRKFIGRIDNLEEALLISNLNGLWFDPKEVKAGSFKKTANGFEMYLMKYYNCPVKMESVKVKIDTSGHFKTKTNGIYYESKDCIVT